jgi:RNA polymerase sigma-70 factor (ECF subfamily)
MAIRRLRRARSVQEADRDLDDRLLTVLYAGHSDAVRRFVAGRVVDAQQREDVVQETFVRAWRNIDRIDVDNGNPRSFLFTIAQNVVVDQWRSQRRRGETLVDRDVAVTTTDSVEKALERIMIGEVLVRLSPEHREVIKALYFDDLTVAEAADRLDVAIGTVKSRSYYAVRALRAAFDEMGLL